MVTVVRALKRPIVLALAVLPLLIASVLVGSIGFVTQQTSTKKAAQAEVRTSAVRPARHGAGYMIGGQWFGTWHTQDGNGFCIEFDKADPNSSGVSLLPGNVPGMNPEQSNRVQFVTNKYGDTRSRLDGAAAAIYIWKTQNSSRFDRFYKRLLRERAISAKLQRRIAEIADEAKNHGPFKLSMKMGSGYVGQQIKGTVIAKAANGKRAADLPIRVKVNSKGKLIRQSRVTNSKGELTFTVRVTRLGAVRADARLMAFSHRTTWITRPSAGHQRLVLAGNFLETARAYATSQRTLSGPSVTSVCGTDCRGEAPVTVRMYNSCGSSPLRIFIRSNGRLVSSFDVAACRSNSKTLKLSDGVKVTTAYCYLNGSRTCIDAPVTNPGTLTVVCPAWVDYRYSGTCPCEATKTLTYSLMPAATSPRSYTATLVKVSASGATQTQTISLVNGSWRSFRPLSVGSGDRVRLTFTVLGKSHLLDASLQQS